MPQPDPTTPLGRAWFALIKEASEWMERNGDRLPEMAYPSLIESTVHVLARFLPRKGYFPFYFCRVSEDDPLAVSVSPSWGWDRLWL